MNPITVVQSGSNVQSATGTEILLNSKIPFTKLDTTNIISFQTISILFNNEPPQPVGLGGYTQTLIYQFSHGYSYIPSIWMMWQNDSPEFPAFPSSGNSATTFYAFGDDTSSAAAIDLITGNSAVNDSGSVIGLVIYNNAGSLLETTWAYLVATVDNKNVNIYVMKYASVVIGGNAIPLYLAGVTLNLRTYIFTEPATTSTY